MDSDDEENYDTNRVDLDPEFEFDDDEHSFADSIVLNVVSDGICRGSRNEGFGIDTEHFDPIYELKRIKVEHHLNNSAMSHILHYLIQLKKNTERIDYLPEFCKTSHGLRKKLMWQRSMVESTFIFP